MGLPACTARTCVIALNGRTVLTSASPAQHVQHILQRDSFELSAIAFAVLIVSKVVTVKQSQLNDTQNQTAAIGKALRCRRRGQKHSVLETRSDGEQALQYIIARHA